MKKGAIVCYESTVYPGVTEDICGPVLAKASGLKQGKDFKLGYSPERINPGDKKHRLETIVKVVSGENQETLDILASIYGQVVKAGIHQAPSIKVAEAAKVIENTQRDLNIALMNELALIFDKLGIRTADVLAAAGTKWNFLPFTPGLVGGHCIGVDPYYLTYKAEEMGYIPQVILSGRRINDSMGKTIAEKTVKLLCAKGNSSIASSRVAILGLTFKEDVPDLRNSRVPDIAAELRQYGIEPLVHDSLGDPDEAFREYGISLSSFEEIRDLDALILAVGHEAYIQEGASTLISRLRNNSGVFVDVKSLFSPEQFPETITYWSL
ncbi:UDP-N-acetyl-D-glucosamine 6-dehydrogenase [bioreactor metagenome]|uniref:UDP-N-acetyl-D-glucosamine 6-dehydrogenase n=1 Tax=bioreactor metagenome TaxID=1076179 RepID=A0A645C8X8_9ZZZZ